MATVLRSVFRSIIVACAIGLIGITATKPTDALAQKTDAEIDRICRFAGGYADMRECYSDLYRLREADIEKKTFQSIEQCTRFTDPQDQVRCLRDFAGKNLPKSAENPSQQQETKNPPYCLPMTVKDMNSITRGERVKIKGVDNCSQIWN